MRGIVVCLPLAAVLLASWWFGGYQLQAQFVAYALVLAGGALWLMESATRSGLTREFILPAVTVPLVGALLLGIWHLTPAEESLVARMEHAEFEELRSVVAQEAIKTNSLYPPATRLRLAVFAVAFLTMLMCCEPARSTTLLRLILGLIAVNGMCIAAYGMMRRIQGSDLIYDSLSAQAGFSSFINRNQAAGFLNMSIAAAVGWLMLLAPESPSKLVGETGVKIRRRQFSLSECLSNLSGEQLMAATCIVVMAAGVLMTTSRGGIGSLAIAATVVAIVATRRFGLVAPCVVLAGGLAVALSAYLGEWTGIQTRLESLSDPTTSWEGRLTHWKDTSGAVRDFPITGTGWGTYAYANLPYQRHQMELWYFNADNLYFEALVEGGAIGLGCYLLLWLLLLGAVIRLSGTTAGRDGRALAFAGLMVLVSQAVHSATDFGLLRPSNGLLFALLMGLLLGEAVHTVRLKPAGRWLSLVRLPGWTRVAFGMICVGVAGLGVWETSRAAACQTAVQAVPDLDELSAGNDTLLDADHYIDSLNQALAHRRDDAEARFKLAELWVHRYRLMALAELRSLSDEKDDDLELTWWRLTHPVNLQHAYMRHVAPYGLEGGASIRESKIIQENLVPAVQQLRLARRSCPVSRQIDYLAATIGVASPDDPDGKSSIYRALFSAPARSARLMDLGAIAWLSYLDDLAIVCFERGLTLSGGEVRRAWNLLRQRIGDEEIIAEVLPAQPDVLLELIEPIREDDPARPLLISRLRDVAAGMELDSRLRGQVAEATGDYAAAIEAYMQVLAENPEDLQIRIRRIECHLALHDIEGANQQLRLGFSYAPDNSALSQLMKRIREEELQQ